LQYRGHGDHADDSETCGYEPSHSSSPAGSLVTHVGSVLDLVYATYDRQEEQEEFVRAFRGSRGTLRCMWYSLRAWWLGSSVPRRLLVLAPVLAVLAPVCSLLGAMVFSRALRSSAAGWGDLIGAVIGIYLGFWVAASSVFTAAARLASRAWWVTLLGAAGLLPAMMLVLAVTTNLGAPLPFTVVLLWVLVSLCAAWAGSPRRGGAS